MAVANLFGLIGMPLLIGLTLNIVEKKKYLGKNYNDYSFTISLKETEKKTEG